MKSRVGRCPGGEACCPFKCAAVAKPRWPSPGACTCSYGPPVWVGAHSLIEHRASIEGPGTKTPQNLLRASIGLENSDDLIADLQQALP